MINRATVEAYESNCPVFIIRWDKDYWCIIMNLSNLRSEVRYFFNKAKRKKTWQGYREKLIFYNKKIKKVTEMTLTERCLQQCLLKPRWSNGTIQTDQEWQLKIEMIATMLESLPRQQADVHVSHTRKYTSVLPKKEKNEALLIYSALPATNPSITFRLKENIINGMRIGLNTREIKNSNVWAQKLIPWANKKICQYSQAEVNSIERCLQFSPESWNSAGES